MVYTRSKRKLDEEDGQEVVLREGAIDPDELIRDRRKNSKRQKEEQASIFQFFDLISVDLKRHILSFVRQGRYVILASVSQDFHATLKSMPENDFQTHPCTYIWSWKLTKWITTYPHYPHRPNTKKTIIHAIQYDMLHVLQKLLKAVKWERRCLTWKMDTALEAINYNSMQILKWILHDQGWDYKAHKNVIASKITYCNLDMLRYLHETLQVDFNNFEVIESMITKPSVRNVDAIKYVLDIAPTMTQRLWQRERLILSGFRREDTLVSNMLRQKLYDPNDGDPNILVVAMYECCHHRKTINIAKNIIDEDTAKQMKEKQYLRLILQAVQFGRLDIVVYLEEEVLRIPSLQPFIQIARTRNHEDVANYLMMVMDTRRD
ncbi:predicted protein [Chaetoceros tenuissimus]|uniref:Uncharacterized protein n=1 Tax=Chaetoceros tenuissimus TaxID=426638 RepID=A0AAD3HA22_9STRA|nr:predicted protein [Chaetoceros tenuissimus]